MDIKKQISGYSSAELSIIFSPETAKKSSSKNVYLKVLAKNLAEVFDQSPIW